MDEGRGALHVVVSDVVAAAAWSNRALFPETSDTIGRLWRHAIGELIAPAPNPTTTSRRSRVVKTQNSPGGTSNDPVTRIGRNPTDHPTQAVVIYLNGIGLNPQSPRGSVGIACVTQSCIPPR
jgi:hypothetical protein